MEKKVILTVLIPVHNSENYLSALMKTLPIDERVRYLFVNDHSTDDSVSLIRKSKREDFVVEHSERSGAAATRNWGLKFVSSEYVSFVDSDDYLISDEFIAAVDLLEKNIHSFQLFNFSQHASEETSSENLILQVLNLITTAGFIAGPMSKFYSVKFLNEYKVRFPENLDRGEDLIFNLRVLANNPSVNSVRLSWYMYRYNVKSLSKKIGYDVISNHKSFIQAVDDILDDNSVVFAATSMAIYNDLRSLKGQGVDRAMLNKVRKEWISTISLFKVLISKYLNLKHKIWISMLFFGFVRGTQYDSTQTQDTFSKL
ncbi:glycosyltransferase family 2 protein [Weissella confusa]|uniref:glycosyltransferase family 2 protein n=1 Tax=Weissella TaxID=46255 RepID=UPI0018F13286|nr:glycosyltransferase family A protein [Weissella cibaria]MBJ7620277.1 glycosyltransferase family 2 protein [Weissella confusa]MBJ7667816.1 glycosyltransferase family 2 protein [Weissella confusa]MBJ7683083.1 glycosyltransferase family 2 protein [Weissella confusa]MBJ7685270.1 glycosyltransferase family 2 protein [Weissella confusa]MBJ7702560.1 glycosyltransferase family 2 protein [Weissella confusa]